MTTLGFRPVKAVDQELAPWLVRESVRESFRALYASLRMSPKPGVVAITSVMPKEGVSWIASKLACAFSEANDPVALVDISAGTGSQVQAFGLTRDSVIAADLERWTLTRGLVVATTGAADGTLEAQREIAHLLRSGRTVLIDCEPLSVSSQVLQLAQVITGVLFVVEAERGRKEAVAAGIAKLEWAGLQVLGTVLNKRRKYVPGALYRAL